MILSITPLLEGMPALRKDCFEGEHNQELISQRVPVISFCNVLDTLFILLTCSSVSQLLTQWIIVNLLIVKYLQSKTVKYKIHVGSTVSCHMKRERLNS